MSKHYHLQERIPDEAGEFVCPECGWQCTKGPSGTEYGHQRGRRGGSRNRCPRRSEDVDPDKPGSWRE